LGDELGIGTNIQDNEDSSKTEVSSEVMRSFVISKAHGNTRDGAPLSQEGFSNYEAVHKGLVTILPTQFR
jgi:hypothetical protein